tara:strand:+ start:4029 stop:5762 length:1734 start_codon:yes stop_codon:yes gene_type:complete
MAKKVVEVELKTVGAEEAVADINDVSQSLNKLEKQEKGTTKQTEKLTTRVSENGGAMGILNQLTGGMAQTFKDAGEAVGLTGKSLKGLKGALLATGIGVAVIAVGYLVNNFDKVTDALGITNPRLEKFTETVGEAEVAAANASRGLETLRDVVLDVTADEKARTEALTKLTETVKGLNGVTLDQEGALQKVVEMTQPYIEASQKRAKADAFAALIAEEEAKQIKERMGDLQEVERLETLAIESPGKALEKAVAKRVKYNKRIAEEDEFIGMLNEKYMQLTEEALAAENVTRNLNDSIKEQTEVVDKTTKSIEKSTKAVNEDVQAKTLAQKAFEKDLIDNQFFIPGVGYVSKETFEELTARQNQARADEEQADKDDVARAERIAKMKQDIEQRVLDAKRKAVDGAIALFGAETKAGKAALIAKQILSAQEMIEEARKTITFSSLVAARSSAAVAEGTAQTAKIGFPQNIPMLIAYALQAAGIISAISSAVGKSKNVASGLGAGGGVSVDTTAASTASSVSSVSAPSLPPQFSTVGASGVNQIASLLGDQPPVQAFVVSGDVTTAQELDRNIITSASIG